MGILDDAIREHLDLKRKHGVSEQELQRQEEEALGPARRDVAAAEAQDENGAAEGAAAQSETAQADADELSPEALAADAAIAPPLDAPAAEADMEPAGDEPAAGDAGPDHLAAETELHELGVGEDERQDSGSLEQEADHPSADYEPSQAQRARGDTPSRGFEAVDDDELLDENELLEEDLAPAGDEGEHAGGEGEHAGGEGESAGDEGEPGGDADVLEDTPDFLQETPEHDRLWFEQKPPRDFDFD